MKVLIGKGVGRKNENSSESHKFPHANIFSNFVQYGLSFPEIYRMDVDPNSIKRNLIFDAIVCDPPYGRRAQLKKEDKDNLSKRKPEPESISGVKPENIALDMKPCLNNLYDLARKTLKIGGRLVLLFHMNLHDRFDEVFPLNPEFELISKSINQLTKDRCRVLVTLQRLDIK